MKCSKVKDLLLTDYMDGETSPELSKKIEEHLITCETCRDLYAAVKERTVLPLREAESIDPPEGLLGLVRDRISAKKQPAILFNISSFLKPVYLMGKPALVAVSILLIVLAGVKYQQVRDHALTKDFLEQQMTYFDDTNGNGNGFGTSIEEFFL